MWKISPTMGVTNHFSAEIGVKQEIEKPLSEDAFSRTIGYIGGIVSF